MLHDSVLVSLCLERNSNEWKVVICITNRTEMVRPYLPTLTHVLRGEANTVTSVGALASLLQLLEPGAFSRARTQPSGKQYVQADGLDTRTHMFVH